MLHILWTSFWAACASAFCSVLFNAGKPDILPGALAGGIGWFVYRFVFVYMGFSEPVGYLLGAFALALFSEILAYSIRNPATVFLLPGLFPLVPGYGIFSAMRAVVTGDKAAAIAAGYSTLLAAGSIALGIAVAASVARLLSMAIKMPRKR